MLKCNFAFACLLHVGVATQTEFEMKSVSCQTELSGEDLVLLDQQLLERQKEVEKLQQTLQTIQDDFGKPPPTCEVLKKDNHRLKFYTGTVGFNRN